MLIFYQQNDMSNIYSLRDNQIISSSPLNDDVTSLSKITTGEVNHVTSKSIIVITPSTSLKQSFVPLTTITSQGSIESHVTSSETKNNQSDFTNVSKTEKSSSQFHNTMTSLLNLIDQSESSLDEPIIGVDSTVSKRDIKPSQSVSRSELYTEGVDGREGGKGVTPPPTVQLNVKFMKQLDHLDEYMVNFSKVFSHIDEIFS